MYLIDNVTLRGWSEWRRHCKLLSLDSHRHLVTARRRNFGKIMCSVVSICSRGCPMWPLPMCRPHNPPDIAPHCTPSTPLPASPPDFTIQADTTESPDEIASLLSFLAHLDRRPKWAQIIICIRRHPLSLLVMFSSWSPGCRFPETNILDKKCMDIHDKDWIVLKCVTAQQ